MINCMHALTTLNIVMTLKSIGGAKHAFIILAQIQDVQSVPLSVDAQEIYFLLLFFLLFYHLDLDCLTLP